jgi:amino-acid N-acetyltransferase
MKSPLRIRKATGGDLIAIERILKLSDLLSDDVAQHLDGFFVAESEGVVVGTIGIELYATIGLLRSAAVLPSHRARGIGDGLLKYVEARAREMGVEEMVLLTTTAAGYFARKGFATVGRDTILGSVRSSTQFNGACPTSATTMRKHLRESQNTPIATRPA